MVFLCKGQPDLLSAGFCFEVVPYVFVYRNTTGHERCGTVLYHTLARAPFRGSATTYSVPREPSAAEARHVGVHACCHARLPEPRYIVPYAQLAHYLCDTVDQLQLII